jgi:hypothetical protein
VGETDTVKLEVNFIGNPRPEVIWTREGEELVNSRHVQVRLFRRVALTNSNGGR